MSHAILLMACTLAGPVPWVAAIGPAPVEDVKGQPSTAAPAPEAGTQEGSSAAPAPAPSEPTAKPPEAAPPAAAPPPAAVEGAGPTEEGSEAAPPPAPAEGALPVDPQASEPTTPAPLPSEAPPPPKKGEPRAWGGDFHAPLPEPPSKADPSTLTDAPWRGRFWLGVGLAASIPLGGRAPAAGGVVSAAGELALGWRVSRYLGLHTAVSTFAHDAGQRSIVVNEGSVIEEVELGRITAFDLLTARVFLPVHRRIEPWGELGAGVGSRRGPFEVERQAVGLVRAGLGVDFWLAPALTLGASSAYRMTILGDAVGHGLRIGADLGLHW